MHPCDRRARDHDTAGGMWRNATDKKASEPVGWELSAIGASGTIRSMAVVHLEETFPDLIILERMPKGRAHD